MSLPTPEPGLVIRYSYLWLSEHRAGREEGIKDRPCAIVLATRIEGGRVKALVLPVTHRAPFDKADALEMPANIKRHLGLDAARSWVVISEGNQFTWPGPDLRRVGERGDDSIAYGFLPPKFFAELRRRYLVTATGTRVVPRTDV